MTLGFKEETIQGGTLIKGGINQGGTLIKGGNYSREDTIDFSKF